MEFETKRYNFLINLLYPGFIGSMIYLFSEKILPKQELCQNACPELDQLFIRYGLAMIIIVIFFFDFHHTKECAAKKSYSTFQAVLDCLIVLSFFIAFNIILESSLVLDLQNSLFLSMASVKLFSLFWELNQDKEQRDRFAIALNIIFLVTYLLANQFAESISILAVVILFLDMCCYIGYDRIKRFVTKK